jgi:5-methylcytosine-specific restriction endonuclease McrA
MKKHVKNYLKHFSLEKGDYIACEYCRKTAVDIHHIIFKSQGGTDEPKNLIGLCRKCHQRAHGIGDTIDRYVLLLITKKRDSEI